MKDLTKLESIVMQTIWKIGKGFASEIITAMPDPKPAYNTTLTVVRILEKKGFVAHHSYGKSNQYYPVVCKKKYSEKILSDIVKNYFDNSFFNLAFTMVIDKKIELKDIEKFIEGI